MEGKNENLAFGEANHPYQLVKELNKLRKNEEFCDVRILVGSKSFPAHRCVLSSACSYFRIMFSSGLRESCKDEVEIFGISESIFDIILSYMYTGNVVVDLEDIQDLLVAANMFQIVLLKDACCNHLQNRIDFSNCLGLFEFAEAYNCSELKRQSFLFILENFVDVFHKKNEEFLNLSYNTFSEFLGNEYLKVESEEQIFHAALQWLIHDEQNRFEHVTGVLSKVRLSLLPDVKVASAINRLKEGCKFEEEKDKLLNKIEHTCRNFKKLQVTIKYNVSVRKGALKFIYIVGGYRSPHGFSWLSGDCLSTTDKFDLEFERRKSSMPQMHEAKRSHSCAIISGIIYVFGGECESMLSNIIERYDPHLNKWIVAGFMSTPRCGFSVAVVEDTVFIIGGCVGAKLTKDIDMFYAKTNKMEKVGELLAEKAYFGCTVCQGNVYVSGGVDRFDEYLATTEMLDPFPFGTKNTGQLRTKEENGIENERSLELVTKNKSKMATARSNHSLVSLNDFIYSIGGQSNPKYTLKLVDRYNPKSDVWETVTLLPDPRSHIAAVVHQGRIYVIGGRDQNGNTLKSLIYFIPERMSWSQKFEIELDRCDMAAVVL